MTPSRPYLIRALYEWIVDNHFTPHILVNGEKPNVLVPRQYVKDGKIVLNVAPHAVDGLELGNQEIVFSARFGGKPMELFIPVDAVIAIYAKENGQGMMFSDEHDGSPGGTEPTPPKPGLRVVK